MLGFVPVAFAIVLGLTGVVVNPTLTKQMQNMGDWKGKSNSLFVEICTRLNLIRPDTVATEGLELS